MSGAPQLLKPVPQGRKAVVPTTYETVRLEPVRRAELLALALNWLLSRFFEKTAKMSQNGKKVN